MNAAAGGRGARQENKEDDLMTLRRWMILSIILLVPGFILLFLSRTVDVPAAGVIGGLLLAAGLAIQLFAIRCPECGAHLPTFPGEYCKHCGNRLDWDKTPRF